ncbi:MAG: sensor histidine kinase [Dorea sp.]
MKRQWYKTSFVKGILIVLEHIFLIMATISVLWLAIYPALRSEIFTGNTPDKYEDTNSFNEQLRANSNQIINGISMKDRFETDGVYNPKKIVDIQEYYQKSEIMDEDICGLSYYLQDLEEWGNLWIQNGEDSSYDTGEVLKDPVIVCKKPDNTYQYYYYSELRNMVDEGELRFVIASDEGGISEEDILDGLQDGSFANGMEETPFKGLQDAEGKIAYIDCWSYDGNWLEEEYQTVDGKSVLDVANENPLWNGRLNEAYDMLRYSIYRIDEELGVYSDLSTFYQEGDTNFVYLYVDLDTQQICTNREAYQDYDRLEKSLDQIRGLGKYAVIRPELSEFETNLKRIDVEEWRDEVKYSGNEEKNFIYAVGVDTTYPIKDPFYTESQLYSKYRASAGAVMVLGPTSLVLFFIVLVWLTVAAGRNGRDEELHLNWFDRWKTELAAVTVIGCWIVPVVLCFMNLNYFNQHLSNMTGSNMGYDMYQPDYVYNSIPYIIEVGMLAGYTCMMFLIGYMSLIKRIKAHTMWENSILKWCGNLIREIFHHIHEVWKVIIISGFIWVFTLYLLYEWSSVFAMNFVIFWGIQGAEAAGFIYLIKQAIGRQRIKTGIEKIAGGELDYKIPLNGLEREQRMIAEKVNSIGEGLDMAVEKSIRSERLKTDLITNVSHDIKTPLTSIINYVELLKQENFEDPRIQRYIEVLEQKSQRLKTLTEDVVEASKVSSGNITLEYMNINLVEMIQQTSGEFEEKFTARDLQEVLSVPDQDVIIRADGRRLWRVLSNIYNNAAKYAMRGTRVYATLEIKEEKAVFSLKNISEQSLNISADELTERFIRGDVSRSTEGSGLGLSIAQSLTEMQGGTFELYLDGDLFKVTITFPLQKS